MCIFPGQARNGQLASKVLFVSPVVVTISSIYCDVSTLFGNRFVTCVHILFANIFYGIPVIHKLCSLVLYLSNWMLKRCFLVAEGGGETYWKAPRALFIPNNKKVSESKRKKEPLQGLSSFLALPQN